MLWDRDLPWAGDDAANATNIVDVGATAVVDVGANIGLPYSQDVVGL